MTAEANRKFIGFAVSRFGKNLLKTGNLTDAATATALDAGRAASAAAAGEQDPFRDIETEPTEPSAPSAADCINAAGEEVP